MLGIIVMSPRSGLGHAREQKLKQQAARLLVSGHCRPRRDIKDPHTPARGLGGPSDPGDVRR